MRKSLLLVGIPVAAVGVAAAVVAGIRSQATPADAFTQDLQRAEAAGLDLAQAQRANKYALTEIAPETKRSEGTSIRKGAGPKAVRSKTPTVKAAPEEVAASVTENVPQVDVVQP